VPLRCSGEPSKQSRAVPQRSPCLRSVRRAIREDTAGVVMREVRVPSSVEGTLHSVEPTPLWKSSVAASYPERTATPTP
jgi:hypothetical protein